MMRDDLLQQLSELPHDVEIGVEVAGEHVDIAGLAQASEGGLTVLQCHLPDVLDMLKEWGIPKRQRKQIALSESNGVTAPEPDPSRLVSAGRDDQE